MKSMKMQWTPTLSTAMAMTAALVVAMPAVADSGEQTGPGRFGGAPGLVESDAIAPGADAGRQDRGRGRQDDPRRDRRGRDDDDRRGHDRGRQGPDRGIGGEGPAFCRTGEGHPVFGMSWCFGNREGPAFCRTGVGHPKFGMRWCYEKGFVPGAVRWRQYDPGDIVFDRLPRRRADRRSLGERILDDILGDVIYGRLVSHRDAIGFGEDLEGRWYAAGGRSRAQVLQVRAGELPLAEFIDLDGDGRVDMALVLEP